VRSWHQEVCWGAGERQEDRGREEERKGDKNKKVLWTSHSNLHFASLFPSEATFHFSEAVRIP